MLYKIKGGNIYFDKTVEILGIPVADHIIESGGYYGYTD